MNKKALRADILLLLTAGIWGFGFVAQRSGMEYVGPFAYNGIRFILGSLSLVPLILFLRSKNAASEKNKSSGGSAPASSIRTFLLYSLIAGSCLFLAVILQQFGIMFTTAGNAGFITGLYVIFTPIAGIFWGRKTGAATWIGSLLTLTGLYFLTAVSGSGAAGIGGTGGSGVNPGDVIVMVSAVFWTFHVLIIDRLVQKIDPIVLSSGQFAVCGIYSLAGAFLAEPHIAALAGSLDPGLVQHGMFAWHPFPALLAGIHNGTLTISSGAIIPILYGGLASVGIAYTLQAVAQRDAPPAHATIILCFEGAFAALGGVLLLGEKTGPRTLLGFAFMLIGMLVTQWEVIAKKTNPPDPAKNGMAGEME
ncbi:MAG: DMT family transporter [Treponema sp.]|nr:DMT family transporter [Treponema sp.]